MNPNEKKEILKNLSEKEFRQDLIIPLLSKIGYIAPIEYHGVNERGKDIICFEYDRLKEQRFLSVVAKIGDLTGNAATNAGLMTVVNQVQQAFDNPYEDLYNMRQLFINEVWVMTTGKIVSGAQDSVIHTLRKSNLDKQIRIIGDDRLIELIDRHFSTYWNSSSETKESVIIQRDRLLSFLEELLSSNQVDKATIESIKSSILYSSYNPRISSNIEGLNISFVSSYSVELAKIDPDFDDYIVSKSYGITSRIFQEAKKNLRYSFFDIEDTIDRADKISKLTDPWEFVVEADSYLLNEYPFHRAFGRATSDFVNNISYMEEGLRELKYFKSFLKHKDKLDWVKNLSKSIVNLLPEIENIISNSKEDELVINYIINQKENIIQIEYDASTPSICFKTNYKRIEIDGYKRNKDGTINPSKVIDSALFQFREYIEKLLEYDVDKWLEEYIE
ncbi:hypothetical protein SAMN05421820_11142 [Pedobacter steynii]|uniref:Restriction endonuclease type IV Mrr domain-containing protein n=1 Tax=Pedobacter steynii TaxID=430522 RepID=A0A1H0G4S3_9SPHI|nr:hypothetical protein [Pedobacter steynii]NQX42322.1 hypothetical protein [Pedobacter steynii]SDO01905.1 hypothetical protein SAMN05421820_11142 [Pedobacter steynii]